LDGKTMIGSAGAHRAVKLGAKSRLHLATFSSWISGPLVAREWESPHQEIIMKAITNLFAKLVKDEQGGEVLEYALIAGLIVVAAIAVIGAVGTKVVARWTSLNSSL
jgi:pilus assembly protein Flp/PilA